MLYMYTQLNRVPKLALFFLLLNQNSDSLLERVEVRQKIVNFGVWSPQSHDRERNFQ